MKTAIKMTLAMLILVFLTCTTAVAQEEATTEELYQLVLKAVPVIEKLGEEGLEAFKDPKGEFVVKKTYAFVLDCSTMTMAAHPVAKLLGISLYDTTDQNPDPAKVKHHGREMCSFSKNPNGGWLDFYYKDNTSNEIVRKIGFVLGVPGSKYTVVATVPDETSNIDELNASLK